MKKILNSCLAASTLLAVSLGVQAEEGKPFSGFYVGLEGGFGQLKEGDTKDGSRWSIGGIGGYRHQFDNDLVLGFEGGFHSTADLKASNFGSFFERDYKPTWSASALLGYAFGDGRKNLLFAKVGYSRLRYTLKMPDTFDGEINDALSATLTDYSKGALKLGAGYERKLTDTFSVRVGADYTKYKQLHKQLEAKVAFIVNF